MHLQVINSDEFQQHYTPAQRDVVHAWFAGNTTDKALARALGISIAALHSRVKALFYKAGIPFGTKRDHAMLMIWGRGLIDVRRIARRAAIVLLSFICSGIGNAGGDYQAMRNRSPKRPAPARMARTARRSEYVIDPSEKRYTA